MPRELIVALLVACCPPVLASSGATAAPAEMSIEPPQANVAVGGSLGMEVRIQVEPSAPPLIYFLQVPPCATLVSGVTRRALKAGESVLLPARVRAAAGGECIIIATLRTAERPGGGHLQTTRAVVLNPGSRPGPGVTRGRTSSGERTIEVESAR